MRPSLFFFRRILNELAIWPENACFFSTPCPEMDKGWEVLGQGPLYTGTFTENYTLLDEDIVFM